MRIWPHITPQFVRSFFPQLVWNFKPSEQPKLYLSFDDGPHPTITPWVLDILDQYQAKASFFCVGANAEKYPELLAEIKQRGHELGNHTHNHLNGLKYSSKSYARNVAVADQFIQSPLFRPPYGKITLSQYLRLRKRYKVIMWSVLSFDFDPKRSADECLRYATSAKNGDIVLFHDSEKAKNHLMAVLPAFLDTCRKRGLGIEKISSGLANHTAIG